MADIILPEVKCSTAEEFLWALSPIGEYFKDEYINAPWLFRGQGEDKNWPLKPSLFRTDEYAQNKLRSLTKRNIDDYLGLRRAEIELLSDFFDVADKRGLVLPDDSQELRLSLQNLRSLDDHWLEKPSSGWPIPDNVLSLAALAQHYGIPTRLLDWTRQSTIAAYFAAESAVKENDRSKDGKDDPSNLLVVWAFYFPLLGMRGKIYSLDDPVRIVTAPSASNPNLQAQRGIFTQFHCYYTKECETFPIYPSLDEFLADLSTKAGTGTSETNRLVMKCKLRKFTLPKREAKSLLYLLAKQDITPSAIYPGYQSIISDMKNQNRWE
jgi:hypothetical protein